MFWIRFEGVRLLLFCLALGRDIDGDLDEYFCSNGGYGFLVRRRLGCLDFRFNFWVAIPCSFLFDHATRVSYYPYSNYLLF